MAIFRPADEAGLKILQCIPVVNPAITGRIFFDLAKTISFLDGHWVVVHRFTVVLLTPQETDWRQSRIRVKFPGVATRR